MDDRQLTTRLRSAYGVDMDDAAQRDQIATIASVLTTLPPESPVASTMLERWRTKIVALIAAVSLASPVAVAVAAEGTVPGDVLYPVKQVTEDFRSVFDPTISARHRIQEAEQMHESGHPSTEVDAVLTDADNAIDDIGDPVELRSQWAETRDRIMMSDEHENTPYTTSDDVPDSRYESEHDVVQPSGGLSDNATQPTDRYPMDDPAPHEFSTDESSHTDTGTEHDPTPTPVAPVDGGAAPQEDPASDPDWNQDGTTGSNTESDNMSPESSHDATTDQSSDWTTDRTDHDWGN
ncbi:MAG: hypothetical protein M3132_12180 [Actinomycetia bacterium]|nr:hypothetical protein [Actinomycetes bacterium]